MRKWTIGILVLFGLLATGCPVKPYVAAQRTILNAVDALHIADEAIVAAYPSVEGTDEERIAWLTKAVCALRISRDLLQVGWDVTFYWADKGQVCMLDGEVVEPDTEGAECTEGARSWQDWVRISVPVVIHAVQILKDFGVEIPGNILTILEALASNGALDEELFDEDFDACVEALEEE
jgi:hypothetical protein